MPKPLCVANSAKISRRALLLQRAAVFRFCYGKRKFYNLYYSQFSLPGGVAAGVWRAAPAPAAGRALCRGGTLCPHKAALSAFPLRKFCLCRALFCQNTRQTR